MNKILGLDLGTNSIGWAIRNIKVAEGSQIIDKGVVVFKKGVGDGKSGEFSLAAERRNNRSKRRLYNVKRYRKWELLKFLIANEMCPLSREELDLWRVGEWVEINGKKKNKGRKYPLSPDFTRWLAMDFEKIGKKYIENEKLKPAFRNPYELRCELIEKYDENDIHRLYKIGRALYHLVQRRGFKTSRKSGKSGYGENEYFKSFYEKHTDKKDWTASKIWLYLLSQADDDEKLRINRIRNSGVIQRIEYEKEFEALCKKQKLNESLSEQLYKAIYFVRPLRTQKGLVGKCTLESNKSRLPISHPLFEEFRALQFINNIKSRIKGSNESFQPIDIKLKKQIFEKLFFRESKPHFSFFEEISKRHSEDGMYEFNYDKTNPSVSACPVISGLMNVFEDEWQNKFIENENEFGINWQSFKVNYKISERTKVRKEKENELRKAKNKPLLEIKDYLNYEEVWHLLFDYLQTKDKQELLQTIAKEKFGWTDEKAKEFAKINIQQGYRSLSKSAISKILPYLIKGNIYDKAVVFANLENVFGKEAFENNKKQIFDSISETISIINDDKERLNIVNGLIQKFFGDNRKCQGPSYILTKQDKNYILQKLENYFGKDEWVKFTQEKQNVYLDFLSEKYLKFIQGKQNNDEKASYKPDKPDNKLVIDYYKLPRQDEAIKQMLKANFGIEDEKLKHLWHHSDIDIYEPATDNKLGDPQPPTKGWKNPMAMRTMYELKILLNYLIEVGKIDRDTRVVIEMARELNDTNMRKAIRDWQEDRGKEKDEYAKAIAEMYGITIPSEDDYDKFRSAVEQIKEWNFSENKSDEFKKKYDEFVETYLKGKSKKNEEQQTEEDNIESEPDTTQEFDYLMHLILNRDEFVRILNFSPPGSNKWITQIIKTSSKFREKRKALKEMLTKYRLWREQKFQCLYTGRMISFTDLFDGTKCQIEHTIPRSISFDSELKNLTVCDTVYNNDVKKKQFPTQCPNYENPVICNTIEGNRKCSPIINRVNDLIKPKSVELEKRISNLKAAAKEIPDWKIDKKNANIQLRHYLNFELQYWKQKLFTFEVERNDWKDKFKNSQLVDTQIITKYARAFLKSFFKRVDVQKGIVTYTFREIYQLPPKYRGNHSHHAVDAAILTLIPGSATRDKQMKDYFEWEEGNNSDYRQPKPYDTFSTNHVVEEIENNVLVNHISKDKALTPSKKFARKRGLIEYLKDKKTGKYILDKDGNKIPKIMQGDSIRGQLHLETFFGVIMRKPIIENGKTQKELRTVLRNGIQVKKDVYLFEELDEPAFTLRKSLDEKTDITKIVDPAIIDSLLNQIEEGKKLGSNDFYFNGNKIRHVRVFERASEPIKVKKHIFISSKNPELKTHKQWAYATNRGNYCLCIYKGVIRNQLRTKTILKNLKSLGEALKVNNVKSFRIKDLVEKNILLNKNNDMINLYHILKIGDKVIFYENTKESIKELYTKDTKTFSRRIYILTDFETNNSTINLRQCIEARAEGDLPKGNSTFDFNNPPALWRGSYSALESKKAIFEHLDFEMKPDGEIIFKF